MTHEMRETGRCPAIHQARITWSHHGEGAWRWLSFGHQKERKKNLFPFRVVPSSEFDQDIRCLCGKDFFSLKQSQVTALYSTSSTWRWIMERRVYAVLAISFRKVGARFSAAAIYYANLYIFIVITLSETSVKFIPSPHFPLRLFHLFENYNSIIEQVYRKMEQTEVGLISVRPLVFICSSLRLS